MDRYAHGYFNEIIAHLKARKAGAEAAFFLPLLQPGMRVLDCGAGPGTITVGLAERVAPGEVVGIDIDAGQVALASENAARLGLANVSFRVADLHALTFADASFDAVFAHTVLQHLPDPPRALREMSRVLRPSGAVGLREEDWGASLFHPMNDTLRAGMAMFLGDWQRTGGDPFLPRRYRELLRGAGFAEIHTSATAVTYEGARAQQWAEMAARYTTTREFEARVLASCMADPQLLRDVRAAWAAWGADPDAFCSLTFCEAVAIKAP